MPKSVSTGLLFASYRICREPRRGARSRADARSRARLRDTGDRLREFALSTPRCTREAEIAARQVLHREVMQLRRRDADVVHRDDVRMRERGEHARFLQEALGELRIGGERRRHHLDRDFALKRVCTAR